ncbi:hypothetical protein BDV93DRAFT_80619 [Ceratobasidium sp. AG-I]|nr:hypothetical protein BDV93DRAFT_80619 [Ceratobasidium sp. AG-I]
MDFPLDPTTRSSFSSCRHHDAGPDMTCMDCIVLTTYPLPKSDGERPTTPPDNQTEMPGLSTSPTSPVSSAPPISPVLLSQVPIVDFRDREYMLIMQNVLLEMDTIHGFVPGGRFLDLGCCPGGFSTYVMRKWPSARGTGVSLPVECGGHSLAAPIELRDQLDLHWADVTMFDFAPQVLHEQWDTSTLAPCPIPPRSFNFVMADGHIHPAMLEGNPRAVWSRDRLLLSQLLLALRSVKAHGTLLAKFSLQISVSLMRHTVVALSRLSLTGVQAIKPRSYYANKATFYILVQGVDVDKCDKLTRILENLWCLMTFGGPKGVGRSLINSDLDDIAIHSDVLAERQHLKAIFDPIEEVQKAALAAPKTNRRRK